MQEEKMKDPEKDYKKLYEWLKKILPSDYDKYDLKAKFDSSLTYMENKNIVREEIKILYKDLKEQVEQSKEAQDSFNREMIAQAEKEADEYNKNLSYESSKEIEEFYRPLHRAVEKVCKGFSHLLFVRGLGGIGKSENIKIALHKNNAEYLPICGEVTEAYLYRLIFENNGKIIWLKDTVKILSNLGSMNLLKSATESSDNRILTKSNYSKDQADLPDRFICKCKFIFDFNNIFGAQLREDFEALKTRGDYIEIAASDEDIKNIMISIAKTDEQKEVTNYLINNYDTNGMIRLNLRTQWKAMKTYEFAKANGYEWKEEVIKEINADSRIRKMLYSLIGNKAVRTTELKKLLIKREMLNTLRNADYKINEWLFLDELHRWSEEDRNYLVCINPKPTKMYEG